MAWTGRTRLRAARESARQNAITERERAAAALHDVGVPATNASAWLDRRGLPAAGNGQLPDLDDPHALDRGSPTATAVLRLLGHDLPDSAEAWRMAWEEHGIDRCSGYLS